MAQRVSKNGRRLGHTIGSVYLVHLNRSYNGARHYLGFSTRVSARLKEHKAGRGAPLLGAAAEAGIPFKVVRTWRKRDGYFEQAIKRNYKLADVCPVCSKHPARVAILKG